MPPRRSHKKSRAGCRRCKTRKIKCDEVHPKCGNCVKHGVPCDFENPSIIEDLPPPTPAPAPATTQSLSSTVSTSAPLDTPSASTSGLAAVSTPSPLDFNDLQTPTSAHPASVGLDFGSPTISIATPSTPLYTTPSVPTIGSGPPNNRLLELRLMHQYTSMTSKTLVVNSPLTNDIWQNTVPRLAVGGAGYLADAMLAVAALHLRSFNPDDKALIRASHSYMASSLAEYCSSLNKGINEENAEPLFLTATLIAFQSSASRIFIRDDASPKDPSSVYSLPLPWFHAFQGVKTVVASSWMWIRNSGIVLPIIESQPVLQLDMGSSSGGSFFGHLLEGLEEELQEDADKNESPATIASTKQSYYHAVAVLNWAHRLPHRGAALAFPATVSKRFLDLLEARRPRALATLACFFALLKTMESVWWLQGAARREVMGIVSQFEATSPWWSHLEWPVRIALYDGAVIPPDVWGSDWVTEENKTDKGSTMLTETFVNHIEILAGMLSKSQTLPPVPIPADAIPS